MLPRVPGNSNQRRLLIRVSRPGLVSDQKTVEWAKHVVLESTSLEAKNLRVSSRGVEFDVFSDDPVGVAIAVSKLESALGPVIGIEDLSKAKKFYSDKEAIRHALELYGEERFWEAHEILEGVWRKKPDGPEKKVLQGLILLCAAYVHLQKGEKDVTIRILKRALNRLYEGDTTYYFGIDLRYLRTSLASMVDTNEASLIRLRVLG